MRCPPQRLAKSPRKFISSGDIYGFCQFSTRMGYLAIPWTLVSRFHRNGLPKASCWLLTPTIPSAMLLLCYGLPRMQLSALSISTTREGRWIFTLDTKLYLSFSISLMIGIFLRYCAHHNWDFFQFHCIYFNVGRISICYSPYKLP